MISDIIITKKNEKPGTHRAFSDKVARDIDDFTDEPIVQCDVQVLENTFIDDSK